MPKGIGGVKLDIIIPAKVIAVIIFFGGDCCIFCSFDQSEMIVFYSTALFTILAVCLGCLMFGISPFGFCDVRTCGIR